MKAKSGTLCVYVARREISYIVICVSDLSFLSFCVSRVKAKIV